VVYLKANQGGIYTISKDLHQKRKLELRSCYAFERKKYREKVVDSGEGILGEAFREKRTIYITKIPDNYVRITSGLGDATPTSLLITPLKVNDEIEGMIEIASFQKFLPHEIDFVEKVCESVASTIISVKINEKTKELLENAQLASEMMRAQEEEMRQNMEELQATQEEMQRKEKAITQMLSEAEERERLMQNQIQEMKEMQEQLTEQNAEIQRIRTDEEARLNKALQTQKAMLEKVIKRHQERESKLRERLKELEDKLDNQ
jgi:GAF domain-containing protein